MVHKKGDGHGVFDRLDGSAVRREEMEVQAQGDIPLRCRDMLPFLDGEPLAFTNAVVTVKGDLCDRCAGGLLAGGVIEIQKKNRKQNQEQNTRDLQVRFFHFSE